MLITVFASLLFGGGPTNAQEQSAAQAVPQPPLGYSKRQPFNQKFKVPKKPRPTFVFPAACRLGGSVSVSIGGQPASEVESEPSGGQYRVLVDGSILFSTSDTGKQAEIQADVHKRVIACLVYTPNSIDYTAELFHTAVQSKLAKIGFSLMDPADEGAWVRKLGPTTIRLAANNRLPADELKALSQLLNATAFLVAEMDPDEFRSQVDPSIHRVSMNGVAVLYDLETGKLRSAFGSSYKEDVKPFEPNRSARQRIADRLVADLLYGFW